MVVWITESLENKMKENESRGVNFNKADTKELAMFIMTLVEEGANYIVRSTNDGWVVLVRGV